MALRLCQLTDNTVEVWGGCWDGSATVASLCETMKKRKYSNMNIIFLYFKFVLRIHDI